MNKASVVFFAVYISVVCTAPPPNPNCASERCLGPLKFYKDLGCKPIYKTPTDCCPIRYNCDHLRTRSQDKCHAFGKEYNIGDEVRGESGTLGCFPPCTCTKKEHNVENIGMHLSTLLMSTKAEFACTAMSLPPRPRPECYRPRNATQCHPEPEICFDRPEDVPTCQVDGKLVKAGDYFSPEAEPRKACWCGPGYNGENVTPFCKDRSAEFCSIELHHEREVEDNCSPLFDLRQDMSAECTHQWRCHQEGDKVIPRELILGGTRGPAPVPIDEPGMECKLGPLTLKHFEGTNRVINDKCTACVCEVPPALTCVNLPKSVCSM